MERDLVGLMDVGLSLLEIHKLMSFLQEAEEPTLKLQFQHGPYGPDAEHLRHVLSDLEGHSILGYGEGGGDDPSKPIKLIEGAGLANLAVLDDFPQTHERFGHVGHLIEGFESPYGMELLATVQCVASRNHANTFEDTVRMDHSRNPRKLMFTSHQIRSAWDRLDRIGWRNGQNHADGYG